MKFKLSCEVPGRELETGELAGDRGFGRAVLVGGKGEVLELEDARPHLRVPSV